MNLPARRAHKPQRPLKTLFLSLLLVLFAAAGGARSAAAQSARPCDVYAAASPATPCVAAFSTTRALFSAYNGPLYQVTRQSDMATTDVGLLSDGYANAPTQDTFCAGTSCTITKLYDQTSNHNDLTPAPPGDNGTGAGPNGYDLPAQAAALPVVVGGHRAYGIDVWPGIGYRNDAAKNTAVGAQPQGVYMVSSVLEVPTGGQCCFDFGNAETNNTDEGPIDDGAMDAINLIIDGTGAPATGLDMENGVPGDFRITPGTQFVTVGGWDDGQTTFQLYWGNAQSGTLNPTLVRPLPSQYQPMKQQGAIILGIGGDNSIYGPGYFYEGAMTAGTPSTASMNAVQASIVGSAYTTPTTLTDGTTYTFQNESSQQYLDNSCDGCTSAVQSGVAVVQNPASGLFNQQWTAHAQGNGYFTFVSKQSGLCLDDPYGNGTPSRTLPQTQGTSTMLWQIPCNGQTPQNWIFVPQSDGSYTIQNQGSTTNNVGRQMVIADYNAQNTAGLQMWLNTSNGLPQENWLVSVAPAASTLAFSGMPSSVVAGTAQSVVLKAATSAGAAVITYTGTVHFTSTDPDAVLPADYTYTDADAGAHTFSFTLKTAGASNCITVTDSANALTGQVCPAVTASAVATEAIVAGNNQSAKINTAFATLLQVSVADVFGNPVSGAAVTFTPVATSGASATFSSTTATTSSAGIATAGTLTANGTAGSFTVNATVGGVTKAVVFNLANTANSTFTISETPASLTIQNGQSGTVTLTLTSMGGYASPAQGITFTCSPLPQQSSCSSSGVATLAAGKTTTVSLVIQTAQTRAALKYSRHDPRLPLLAFLPGVLLLPFAFARKRHCWWMSSMLSLLLLGFGLGFVSGCSGGSASTSTASATGTPAGTTNVVVSATDGTVTQTVPITVVVQ